MTPSTHKSIVSYDTEAPLITQVEYQAFQEAYDFFNVALFGGGLPQVLVTLQRRARSKGYFAPDRFDGRLATHAVHELALNPDHFVGRSDIEILSTLVHEQVHVWQQTHGTPPRRGYHNREWADHMKTVGLAPSSTGEPGGKETGQRVSHWIVPAGPYAQAFSQLEATGFLLHWQSKPDGSAARGKNASKTKYTCAGCGLNAWARPGAALVCGDCETALEEMRDG
jgi:hypothetical protein